MVFLGTKGDAEELHPGDLSFILGIFGNFWIFGNAATTAALEVVGSIVSVLEEVLVVVVGFIFVLEIALLVVGSIASVLEEVLVVLVGFILLLEIALVVVVEGVISFFYLSIGRTTAWRAV